MQWPEQAGNMGKKSGQKKSVGANELINLEAILKSSLKPVSPRPEFIHDLQKGLIEYTLSPEMQADVDMKKAILYAFFGFAGLVLVFSIWLRLILVIISTLGMIQSSKQRKHLPS